jgi:deazaflavin-dependent oxidoreductase (nitroreductase family)
MSESKLPDWMQDHLDRYLKTDGAEGHLRDFTAAGGKPDTPNLLLTTTGRKSGRAITLPLIYGTDSGRYVVVGSKGGAPEHPAWYLNLVAQPQVGVQVADKKFRATARTASGAERQRLWQLMADIYPPYNDYRKLTSREIPIVVLEPLAA